MMVSGYMEFDEEYAEMNPGTGRDPPSRSDAEVGRDLRGFELEEEVVRGQTVVEPIVLSDDSADASPRRRQREENRRRGREAKAPIVLSDDDSSSPSVGRSHRLDTVPSLRKHHVSSTPQDQALGPDLGAGISAFPALHTFAVTKPAIPFFPEDRDQLAIIREALPHHQQRQQTPPQCWNTTTEDPILISSSPPASQNTSENGIGYVVTNPTGTSWKDMMLGFMY